MDATSIGFALQSLEIIVLVITLVAVVLGLQTTRKHFNVLRSMAYIERFNSESGVSLRSRVDAWLNGADESEKLSRFLSEPALKSTVLAFMNQFQEMGVAFQKGLLDRDVFMEMFDFLVPHYWQRLGFLVEHYRTTAHDAHVYRKFQFLNDEIQRAKSQQPSI